MWRWPDAERGGPAREIQARAEAADFAALAGRAETRLAGLLLAIPDLIALGYGIPLDIASAGENRHDSPLLAPTLEAASRQLDRGYDSTVTRQLLEELGFDGQIARKTIPAPVQADTRWVVERTHSWMNGYGKLRRCTDRNAKIVDFCLYLAAALVTIRRLIQRARNRYRRDTRPTTKLLK